MSAHILAIVTTVGSSSIPGCSGSYGTGDLLGRRSLCAGPSVAVSVPSSCSGADPGLCSGSGTEAFREILFFGLLFPNDGFRERRVLLERLVELDSDSIAEAGRFLGVNDGGGGSGGGVLKL